MDDEGSGSDSENSADGEHGDNIINNNDHGDQISFEEDDGEHKQLKHISIYTFQMVMTMMTKRTWKTEKLVTWIS